MGTALSIFVILSLSAFVIRLASVALRLTGLEESTARFQALSAFTGTGFTTREAEAIVNYPVRRRIVAVLMIMGNAGIVGVGATLVVSLVHTEGRPDAVIVQLAWLIAGLALVWFLILNRYAERLMCNAIQRFLTATTVLGTRPFMRMLQVGDGLSVCEHPVPDAWLSIDDQAVRTALAGHGFMLIGLHRADGTVVDGIDFAGRLAADDRLILYGRDAAHEALG